MLLIYYYSKHFQKYRKQALNAIICFLWNPGTETKLCISYSNYKIILSRKWLIDEVNRDIINID